MLVVLRVVVPLGGEQDVGLETEPKSCVLFFGLCLEIFNQGVGKKSVTVYNFSDLIKICVYISMPFFKFIKSIFKFENFFHKNTNHIGLELSVMTSLVKKKLFQRSSFEILRSNNSTYKWGWNKA